MTPAALMEPWLRSKPAAVVVAVADVIDSVIAGAEELQWDGWTRELLELLSRVGSDHTEEMTL